MATGRDFRRRYWGSELKKSDALEYTQSLGQITGGAWRQIALAKRLGVPKALGMTLEEWVKELGGYTKLSIEDRRQAVAELKAEGESNREIAKVLGVSKNTVNRDANGSNEPLSKSDGPESLADTGTGNTLKAESGSNEPPASDVWASLAFAADVRESDSAPIALLHTGDEESFTPAEYIESARAVMGHIDLDPASNRVAQETVKAEIFYSAEDDGLSKNWAGNVWLNPPYTALVINRFLDKLALHHEAGEIDQAVCLTNNNTDTSWFHGLAEVADAICFTRGRINFHKPDGSRSSPTNGQMFFYLGPNRDGFRREFSRHGLVMVKA